MPTDYAPPTYDEIRTALSYIPTPSSYADWYPMAFAIKDALGENGKDLWHDWSRQGDNYNARNAEATWKAAKPKAGGITVATLFKQARDNGYRPDKPTAVLTPEQFAQRALETATKNEIFAASDAVRYQAAAKLAHTIWRNSKALTAADLAHPYLRNKGIQDVTAVAGIRINRYQGQNKLVIPVYLRDEQTGKTELVNLQQIDEHGTKRFLYGGQKSGGYAILNGTHADMKDGFYLAEGYATAASVHLATGKPVVIAFDAGNLPVVAARIAERDNLPSDTPIYLAADNDRVSQTGLTKATEAAAWLGERAQIRLPEFNAHDITTWQQQHGQLDADGKEQFPSDFNDLMALRGLDAVTTAIHAPLSAERAAQVATMQPEINERIAHFKEYNIQPSRPFQFETLPLDEAGLRFRANLVLEKFGDERSEKHRHALIAELAQRGIDIRAQVAELSGELNGQMVEQSQRQPENEQGEPLQSPNSSTEPRAERAPWGDFPPLVRNGTLDELKNNENYQAAKAGDAKAALDLVQSLLNEQTVTDIQNMVGERKPIIVAIHAEEGIGRNKIPAMMAKVLSMHTGWQVDNQLLQASYAGRTGMDSSYRLAFPPAFSGEVQKGRDYLIVDDNATMGGTIASLRGYIENRGGHVIGATVMSARATGLDIVPTQKQLDAIQRKHGDTPNDYWTNTFGYGIDCLTRGEAGAIRTSPTFDDIRNRIDDARLQRSLRMGGRGTAPQPEASAPSTTESLNPNINPPTADAPNASAVGVLAKENPMAQPSPTPDEIQRHAQNVAQIADAAEREAMMSEMAEQGIYVRGAVNKILAERAAEMTQQPENEHGEFPQSQSGQPENAAPPTFADELSALNLPADFSFEYQVLPNGREIARIHLAGYGGEIMVDKIEADKGGGYIASFDKVLDGKPIHLDNLSTLMREMTFQMRQAAERSQHQEPTAAQPEKQPENPSEPPQPTAADNAAVAVSEPFESESQSLKSGWWDNQPDNVDVFLVGKSRQRDYVKITHNEDGSFNGQVTIAGVGGEIESATRQQLDNWIQVRTATMGGGQEKLTLVRQGKNGYTAQLEHPPEPPQPTAADNVAVVVSEPSETQTVEQPQNQQENTMPTPETHLVLPTREAAVEYEAINRVMQASTLAEMSRIEPRSDGVIDVAQYLQEQLAKNKEQLAHETDNAQREALQDDIAVGEIAVSLVQQGLSPQQLQQRAETLLAEAQRVPAAEVENSIEFGGITQEQAQSPEQPAEAQPQRETISAAEVQENLRRAKEKERIEQAQQFTQEAAVGAAIGIAADAALDVAMPSSSMAKTAASVATDLASNAAAERIVQSNSAQQAERDAPESTEPHNTPEASPYQKPKPILDLDYETPKGLADRYIRMEGKYLDFKNHQTVMFEDKGKKLNTAQSNPQIINDMLDTAQAKNWDSIKISGSLEFKQQVWLEAELRGIKTTGYKPTEEDIAKRDYLLESRYRNSIEAQHQPEINKTAQQDRAQPEPSQQLDSKKTKPAPAATIDEQNAGSLFDDAPKASLPPMPNHSAALHSAADKAQTLADTPQERVAASQMQHQAAHASIQQSSLKGQAIAEQSKPAQSFNPELDSARSVYLQKVETLHKDERLRLQDIEKRLARVINRYPLAEQDEFWRRHYEETANDIKGGKLHNAEHPKQETKPSPSHTVSPSRSNQQHEQGDDGVEIGD